MKFLILFLLTTLTYSQTFTPLKQLPVAEDSITNKGDLLTSDGSIQLPFTACADDQIVVWDSNETLGIKCEAKPTFTSSYIKAMIGYSQSGSNLGGTICFSGVCETNFTQGDFVLTVNFVSQGTYDVTTPTGTFQNGSWVFCSAQSRSGSDQYEDNWDPTTLQASATGALNARVKFNEPSGGAANTTGIIYCEGLAP